LQKSCKKVAKYFSCEKCDYITSRKSSYDKHLLTSKHREVTLGDIKVAKSCTINSNNICSQCNKEYSSRNGLWKHTKTCISNVTATPNIIQFHINQITSSENLDIQIIKKIDICLF
jgi:hypothetical protein